MRIYFFATITNLKAEPLTFIKLSTFETIFDALLPPKTELNRGDSQAMEPK